MLISDNSIFEKIRKSVPDERLFYNEPMSRHTSFRIGGPAALLVQINNEKELGAVLSVLNDGDAEYMLVGNGSNILVSDDGYDGVVLKLGGEFEAINQDEEDEFLVHAGAAVLMSGVSAFLTRQGLSGFEFASGIPGSLGGAVFMNAGAYGGEMKDVVESVRVMKNCNSDERTSCHSDERSEEETNSGTFDIEPHQDALPGKIEAFSNEEMAFGYRTSRAQAGDIVILSVSLRLKKDDPAEIANRVSELAEKRNSKQPVNFPSAGSTFKRPAGGYAAALIEEAGLKGYRVGGAAVSEKHSGFVINEGGATCEDVLEVMRHVRETVLEKSGILLEPEVRLINCSL